MNLALWIATGVLAAVALVGGISKAFMPKKKLAEAPGGGWVKDFSAGFLKTLGSLEILAAVGLILPAVIDIAPVGLILPAVIDIAPVGLILPAVIDIAPVLVPVTAVCWMLLMIGAIITHLRHGDAKPVVANLIYLALAVFIAWGRFGPESFIG